jgi:hypothetical protein
VAERRIHAAPRSAVLFVYDPATVEPIPEAAPGGLIVVLPSSLGAELADEVQAFFREFARLNRLKLPPSLE